MNKTDIIMADNERDKPMVDTHFYAFLVDRLGQDPVFGPGGENWIDTLTAYVKEFDFVIGEDKLDEKALESLRWIHQHYWRLRLQEADKAHQLATETEI